VPALVVRIQVEDRRVGAQEGKMEPKKERFAGNDQLDIEID